MPNITTTQIDLCILLIDDNENLTKFSHTIEKMMFNVDDELKTYISEVRKK